MRRNFGSSRSFSNLCLSLTSARDKKLEEEQIMSGIFLGVLCNTTSRLRNNADENTDGISSLSKVKNSVSPSSERSVYILMFTLFADAQLEASTLSLPRGMRREHGDGHRENAGEGSIRRTVATSYHFSFIHSLAFISVRIYTYQICYFRQSSLQFREMTESLKLLGSVAPSGNRHQLPSNLRRMRPY
jgi:hypothetical protein